MYVNNFFCSVFLFPFNPKGYFLILISSCFLNFMFLSTIVLVGNPDGKAALFGPVLEGELGYKAQETVGDKKAYINSIDQKAR